jgi:hypothetical protein
MAKTTRTEEPPWYQQWREALERVIAAQMARDAAKEGTPERKVADREYDSAFEAFRAIASQIK